MTRLTSIIFATLLTTAFVYVSNAKHSDRDKQLYCGVCMALVEEMDNNILSVNKKKKIGVSGFTYDSEGNRNIKEVSYAKSDVHLAEVLENICLQLEYGYHKIIDPTGKMHIVRGKTIAGQDISKDTVDEKDGIQQSMNFVCQTILEEHEEEIIEIIKSDEKDNQEKICVQKLALCEEGAAMEKMMAFARVVQDGMSEQMKAAMGAGASHMNPNKMSYEADSDEVKNAIDADVDQEEVHQFEELNDKHTEL